MGTRDIAPSLVQSRLYSKQNLSLEPVKGGGNFVTFCPLYYFERFIFENLPVKSSVSVNLYEF